MVQSAERAKKRRCDDLSTMSTPEIEVEFDPAAMEYTVVATTSRDEIQSVTVIDATRRKVENGVYINESTRQSARKHSRKADHRPLSPKSNRSSALEDRRNPFFLLERTSSFDNFYKRFGNNRNKSSDHRQTLESAAREQPPVDRLSVMSSPGPSPVLLLERKRSLPPRAPPPPSQSFGVRVPFVFKRAVSLGGRNQAFSGQTNDLFPKQR